MEVIRRADVYGVDVFSRDHRLPVGLRLLPSPPRGKLLYRTLVAGANNLESQFIGNIEKNACLTECV